MASPDFQASANSPASGYADSTQVALNKYLATRSGVNRSRKQVAADRHYPSAATAAVVTYAAVSGQYHVIRGIAFSYSATPTGGRLTVEDVSGTVIYDQDVTAAGPVNVVFPLPLRSAAVNTALIVTLASGAGAVVGKLTVLGHTTES